MVFLLNNYSWPNPTSASWGLSAIYTTDDASHTSISQYTKCSGDYLDGGFKTLGACKGRYLIIARTGPGMSMDNRYFLNEDRVYSVLNLLDGANVIEDPTPKDPSFSAMNLVQNLETRSGN